ncbi:hypothetical protein NM208_g12256 [Fusarium decemcellulare]|uniref:Uncharacterized protein n=1 Tax=Fusarium decemcellulare TaxID=57161 RepID=A0ACC1RRZ7_9HYPO|nr:hypothetical protein NM208_g12256 [Fusarium decemcellulare]
MLPALLAMQTLSWPGDDERSSGLKLAPFQTECRSTRRTPPQPSTAGDLLAGFQGLQVSTLTRWEEGTLRLSTPGSLFGGDEGGRRCSDWVTQRQKPSPQHAPHLQDCKGQQRDVEETA